VIPKVADTEMEMGLACARAGGREEAPMSATGHLGIGIQQSLADERG
jgi:hypothetical protein